MVIGIDAVAPLRWPAIPGEEGLHAAGAVRIGGDGGAIEEDGKAGVVGHPAVWLQEYGFGVVWECLCRDGKAAERGGQTGGCGERGEATAANGAHGGFDGESGEWGVPLHTPAATNPVPCVASHRVDVRSGV